MDRRTFLKTAGMGSIAFATGCNAHPERRLFAPVRASEDMVTGEPTWYASTCRECPAGCGVLAKNREGRVVKLEGNPLHPVNQGKLCARGQAALQGLYHPDRLTQPLVKVDGRWQPIAIDSAIALLRMRLRDAAAKGTDRIAMLTETAGSPQLELFSALLDRNRSLPPVVYEPLAYAALQQAHALVLGQPVLPTYRLDQADLLIGCGADLLETWLSPVEYGRKFATMHAYQEGRKGFYAHIGAHQSLTGANADQWLACRPGTQSIVVMGLIHAALSQGRGRGLPEPVLDALRQASAPYSAEKVAQDADLAPDRFSRLSRRLLAAKRPLVLPAAATDNGPTGLAAALGSVWLNAVMDPSFALYDLNRRHRVEIAQPPTAIHDFWRRAAGQSTELLLLHNVNPVYGGAADPVMDEALRREGLFKVVFGRCMDETAELADLIIPVQHPLEAWDVYESRNGLVSTLQPTLGRINAASSFGDMGLQLWPDRNRPAADYRTFLRQWLERRAVIATAQEWLAVIRDGGRFGADRQASAPVIQWDLKAVEQLDQTLRQIKPSPRSQLVLEAVPSLRFFDGRGADHPWLAEMPDPIAQVAWQTLAMIPPALMEENGWEDGQPVDIATAAGRVRLPAYGCPGLHPEAITIAMGQGHSAMGRYARNQGANPLALLAAGPDGMALSRRAAITALTAAGPLQKLASVSGSPSQHGRKIAPSVTLGQAGRPEKSGPGLTMDEFALTPPLPEGYAHERDIYPPHGHDTYRWGMVIDLDRCTGCGACVAACYAENNVPVVGVAQIVQGREMNWLRIERYQDADDPTRLTFLPMLCQHCDNAPCESVCPVYAPHHSAEGLNNQIYNRCIGTRFCAQNCPYKVRRFNWFEGQWPEPLPMLLNPDVTVRSKGVMEKCSFCVQRIKDGHNRAKNERRAIRDGEVIPACVQTCPAEALAFGNLMDPRSLVRRKMADPRAYQVLGYLNTKPAVIYLKKVVQQV